MNRRWICLPALCLALSACGGSSSSTKTKPPIGVNYGDAIAVAYGNGVYVAVGDMDLEGHLFPWVATSTDGVNWKTQPQPIFTGGPDTLNSVAYGSAGFMATLELEGFLFTSTDGVTWTQVSAVVPHGPASVSWDGAEYIVDEGSGFETSTDGMNWTPINPDTSKPVPQAAQVIKVASVAYAPLFLPTPASGPSATAIGSSTDLVNWTVLYQAPAGVSLDKVFHIGSGFVAFGSKGEVVTSPDGTTWTSQAAGSFPDLNQVVTNGSVYVGVDILDSKVFYSHDGVTWTFGFNLPAQQFDEGGPGFAAAAPGGAIVIVGGEGSTPYALVGTDGIHWKQVNPFK